MILWSIGMAKEFKTIEELVSILDSRGVVTDAETSKALERESYYAIVNGYKTPFLDTEAMKAASDDVYLEGTRFEWIYDLFLFDRELRTVTFTYLTRAEALMRSAVAYAFSEAHPGKNDYLDRANFCKPADYLVPRAFKGNKIALYGRNLNDLMQRLNSKLTVTHGTRSFIKHYLRQHGGVPLWVLANDLTFGNVVHFYQLMQERDRRKACSIIAKCAERKPDRGALTERKLLRSANVLNHYRNICAHDERLYCATYDGDGYGSMLLRIRDFLPLEESNEMVGEITRLYGRYEDRLHNMEFSDLLKAMGLGSE